MRIEAIGGPAGKDREPIVVLGQHMPNTPSGVGLRGSKRRKGQPGDQNYEKAEVNQ